MNLSREKLRLNRLMPLGIILMLLALLMALIAYSTTDALSATRIFYRYAEQFRAGNGLVFNAGDRVLLAPAPLYLLLLGLGAAIFPTIDISTIAAIIFVISLMVNAIAIYWITRHIGLASLLSGAAALLYILAWPIWLENGTAYPAAAMFCLLVVVFALKKRWQFAGITLACGVLCSPEAILLAIPLTLLAANQGRAARFIVALILPLLLAVFALWLYYGAVLWNGLLLPKPRSSSDGQWFAIMLIGMGLWIVTRRLAFPILNVCAAWIALHLLIVTGLFRVGESGSYGIIFGPALLIAVVSTKLTAPPVPLSVTGEGESSGESIWVVDSVQATRVILLLFVILVVGFVVGFPTVDRPGSLTFPAPTRTIGVSAVTLDVRVLPEQSLLNFDGQLQPELKAILERGDVQSALIRYAPDVLVASDQGKVRVKDLTSPALARLGYRRRQEPDTYIRSATIGSFVPVPITANFGPDIMLTGAALDQSSLKPGQLLRVRLDWQYARAASQNITIDLRLVSGDGDQFLLAHTTDTYDPSVFRAGPYSTYHTLTATDRAWPGPVTLEAAVIINGGVAARVPISTLAIAAP